MKNYHTQPSVYCIFYLERDYYKRIDKDLERYGYGKLVRAIIPTVRILKKTVGCKEIYEEVPILFNYAFMRIPRSLSYSRDFMNKLKRKIPGIRGWVKSPETLHPRKIKRRIDNMEVFDDFSLVATATKKEVRYFQKLSKLNKRFSVEDIVNIHIGDYLVLKGYPYDGVDATVLEVNHNTQMVKLLLYPQMGRMEISLPFDQVIHTVYANYDPELLSISDQEIDMARITEAAINKVLDIKQY